MSTKVTLISALGAFLVAAGTACAGEPIRNYSRWLDVDGDPISCHDGAIAGFGDTFYWYGTSYRGNPNGLWGRKAADLQNGFNVYSSGSLVDWKYEGVCLEFPKTGWLSTGTSHRPNVLHNDKTGKYVMWFFSIGTTEPEYPAAMLAVAVADLPAGPFQFLGQRDTAEEHGWGQDLGLFKDDDGKGYLVYDDGHRNIRVDLLAEDYLTTSGKTAIALKSDGRGKRYEGSAMVKYKSKYIVAGSGVRGWNPTDTSYAVAESPLGPYREMGLMSRENTWNSQISNCVYVKESDLVLAMCDQWFRGPGGERVPIDESCQLWMPVSFDAETNTSQMQPLREWDPFPNVSIDSSRPPESPLLASGQPGRPRMYFADTAAGRPYSKDPAVVKFNGRYWLYYSSPPYEGKPTRGWSIGVAASDNLVDWSKVGELRNTGDAEQNGFCAPGAIVLDGRVHLFYQTYGNARRDAICHTWSEDGIHFTRNPTNPVFRPTGDWNCGRAIDADVIQLGDRLLLYWSTRDPDFKIQMQGVAEAPLESDFGRDPDELQVQVEMVCSEALSVQGRRLPIWITESNARLQAPDNATAVWQDRILPYERWLLRGVLPQADKIAGNQYHDLSARQHRLGKSEYGPYWLLWILRDLRGTRVAANSDDRALITYATMEEDRVTVVLFNDSDQRKTVPLHVRMPCGWWTGPYVRAIGRGEAGHCEPVDVEEKIEHLHNYMAQGTVDLPGRATASVSFRMDRFGKTSSRRIFREHFADRTLQFLQPDQPATLTLAVAEALPAKYRLRIGLLGPNGDETLFARLNDLDLALSAEVLQEIPLDSGSVRPTNHLEVYIRRAANNPRLAVGFASIVVEEKRNEHR